MNTIAKMYPKLTPAEISAIILKGTSMSALLDRDAGFCSGSSSHEDDLDHHSRDGLHSPTDASEDSVEVKVTPISKNKRKSTEPLRVISETELLGPLKKCIRFEDKKEELSNSRSSFVGDACSFRPWAPPMLNDETANHFPNPADVLLRHPGVTTLHRAISSMNSRIVEPQQQQPLALVTKSKSQVPASSSQSQETGSEIEKIQKKPQFVVPSPVVPVDKQANGPRNYKNMTRERRIEANARERTRVHTISAAYEKLRKAVPAYSNSQKLSKLSILRIACSYILTLSRLSGEDYSQDNSEPSIASCIEAVTKTIQTEGKIRKKKDE